MRIERLPSKEGTVNITGLIISLLGGAAGGNLAGGYLKDKSLGAIGDTFAGILGGGLGGALLQSLGVLAADQAAAGLDIGTVIGHVVTGGAGGGIVMAIIGALRAGTAKKV
jgi:uncharacterized membrane protein YeaQ/YmgE (transglycosylase-associated protein family)